MNSQGSEKVEKLNRGKSQSIDGCHPSVLKESNNKAAKLLTQIYNSPLKLALYLPIKNALFQSIIHI